jgi:hypothetical protein
MVIYIMDQYFLAIIGIIIFSLVVIFYIRISTKINSFSDDKTKIEDHEPNDSNKYDNVDKNDLNSPNSSDSSDPLRHLKSSDFTLLE